MYCWLPTFVLRLWLDFYDLTFVKFLRVLR